jgi:uncharacterized membrane protein YbhN (UPF0104 family)
MSKLSQVVETLKAEGQSKAGNKKIPAWLKTGFTLLLSFLILAYFFQGVDWQKLIAASQSANLFMAVLGILLPQLVFWFSSTYLGQRMMVWYHGPFPFWPYFWVKGLTYMLSIISPGVTATADVLYKQKRSQARWSKMMGITVLLWSVGKWGFVLVLIPTLLYFELSPYSKSSNVETWPAWFIILGPGLGIFAFTWIIFVMKKNIFGLRAFFIKRGGFWEPFLMSTAKHWFEQWLIFIPSVIATLIGLYYVSLAFNVVIPLPYYIATAAIALFIMTLPIGLAGLGTTTAAWMVFYSAYGEKEAILAMTLFFPLARSLVRVGMGVVSIPFGFKELSAVLNNDFSKTTESSSHTSLL